MPPVDDDLNIPPEEKPCLSRIAGKLELDAGDPRAVLSDVSRFLSANFTYSTYLTIKGRKKGNEKTALQQFLETERSGHCEYFALSTVMLLRQAGIPARYVVGYSVVEYNPKKKEHIVRGLHGHAWAQAWIDDHWEYVDNTPADWMSADEDAKPFLQPLKDWFSNIPHVF